MTTPEKLRSLVDLNIYPFLCEAAAEIEALSHERSDIARDNHALQDTIDELRRQNAELRECLNKVLLSDQPWPLRDIVQKLCEATSILLNERNYDCHGHEEISAALKAGREWTAKALAAQPEGGAK